MKSKQSCPKSFRPLSIPPSPTNRMSKHRTRCSLCHSLLKPSTTHRYLLMGKSMNEKCNATMTYAQCCERFLNEPHRTDQCQMICPKCSQDLQRVDSLYRDAEELIDKLRSNWTKTKRLNRTPNLRRTVLPRPFDIQSRSPLSTVVTDESLTISVKEENDFNDQTEQINTSLDQSNIIVSETILTNKPYDLSVNQFGTRNLFLLDQQSPPVTNKQRISKRPPTINEKSLNGHPPRTKKAHLMRSLAQNNNPALLQNSSASPFAQLMIESPSSSSLSPVEPSNMSRRSSSTSDKIPSTIPHGPSMDDERSISPSMNDDDASLMNEPKSTRLSRRQYDFLVKLPDQSSLNAFIETSAAESGSRWTWRRTSANSRGYKVYYVCNFSMRRHYHPCPAAMYALFHPEGSISIYSCGQHQHIPKDRLPVSITDATKDEIFKCLQSGMSTSDIRERLVRLQLPFGDTRKLNNFIKYHKELLRFGTVTNVRIGGTAYRQPQCWAIRRQPSTSTAATNDEKPSP